MNTLRTLFVGALPLLAANAALAQNRDMTGGGGRRLDGRLRQALE